jgi:hypothetical protein
VWQALRKLPKAVADEAEDPASLPDDKGCGLAAWPARGQRRPVQAPPATAKRSTLLASKQAGGEVRPGATITLVIAKRRQ